MSSKEKYEILHLNPWRIILAFSVAFLVLEIIFFFNFQPTLSSLDVSFFFYTPALLIASVIFCILSITSFSYKISDSEIVQIKLGKEFEYHWKNIIYINEEYSKKHKTLCFYTYDGREHFLMFDKNGKIFEEATKRVNQISRQELLSRFPNIKL